MNKVAILGNGKSLSDIDFTKFQFDTIGLCLAFRYWEKINWFPTHYVCIDSVVIKSNIEDIKKLVINKKCDKFLFSIEIIKIFPEIQEYDNVFYAEHLRSLPDCIFRYMPTWCSGSAAYIFSIFLGYNDISLFGIDCNYVEFLPETKKMPDGTLMITKTPDKNPNYFFDDYQRAGDNYNIPNGKRVHYQSWKDSMFMTAGITVLGRRNIKVINYNREENESIRKVVLTKPIKEFYKILETGI
jgi:hypothetical protein